MGIDCSHNRRLAAQAHTKRGADTRVARNVQLCPRHAGCGDAHGRGARLPGRRSESLPTSDTHPPPRPDGARGTHRSALLAGRVETGRTSPVSASPAGPGPVPGPP
jgi:hypothetical protein